jgi:outer membrane protein assembly factor BamB
MRIRTILLLPLLMSLPLQAQIDYMQQWPQFRGPFASGILDGAGVPVEWDIRTGQNILWKTPISGLGHSCPVVWGDRVFVTTAVSGSGKDSLKVGLYGDIDEVNDRSVHEFRVYCMDRNTGEIIWERLAHRGIPKTERHTKASHANPTPATDGKHLVVSFGSDGLFCYTLDGELRWQRDLGKMNAGPYTDPDVEWGFASSPILHEDRIILQCDFVGDGFLAALDVHTGREIWRTAREDVSTWSTPNFLNENGHRQVVVNGFKHMGGYDFDSGEQLWNLEGGGDAPTPTPVFAHSLIYLHGSHGRYSPIFAVRPEARGEITLHKDSTSSAFIPWSIKRGAAYMPTNLVYGDYLYNLRMNGNLTCFHATTGEVVYKERIPDAMGITSSGVASDGRLYYSLEQGDVVVVKTGREFEILARNPLGDLLMASPAMAPGMLLFRTQGALIAVGER